jgi:N-acetyl-alpha-D-glucosaminyl L-malate synthase BshA
MSFKILFYTDTPLVGGAEKHMKDLARGLKQKGHDIAIACSNYKSLDLWCEAMKREGIKVFRLNVLHKHDPRHFLGLRKILKQERPDLVHVHVWNPASCRYAFWAARSLPKLKIVATEHDPFVLKGVKNWLKEKTLNSIDHLIAVSEANHHALLNLYPQLKDKISTIHNSIDLEDFNKNLNAFSDRKRAEIREHLFHAQPNDFVIMTVATLHSRKGLQYLIQAFRQIAQKNAFAKLVLVGEGPQRRELERQIHQQHLDEKVFLLGQQKNIPQLLKSSDLFVLPSIKEAFGLVLLEAMAAGLPVIATRVGGIPEIIEDQKNGLLVESKSSDALVEAIFKLMKSKDLRQKLVMTGLKRVKIFALEKMITQTENVYSKLRINN